MPHRSDAEEHLRIIRSLMEKATIYRAISAEAAAVGGVLAIAASFAFGNWWRSPDTESVLPEDAHFFGLWLGVLAMTALSNVVFLWLDARKRGDKFISSGMRLALFALLPSYVVAAFLTWFFFSSPFPTFVVPVWIICHALGLLATSHFAPRSLMILGWAFLVAGLVSIVAVASSISSEMGGSGMSFGMMEHRGFDRAMLCAQRWMAGTFGLFHLIYAACTWPRRGRGADGGAQP